MDKKDYLDSLKQFVPKDKKVKIEQKSETVLMETDQLILKEADDLYKETLNEIFIQSGEIEAMSKGKERDMQILRLSIIAELDASNLYEKLAQLAQDKRLIKVLLDISREEKVHVGEFEELLEMIDPEYEEAEKEGGEEVKELTK